MLDTRGPGGACQVRRLLLFSGGGHVRPEVGDQVGAVGPGERPDQALLVVVVGLHHLGTELDQLLRLRGGGVAGQRADRVAALGVVEDGADQTVALGTGGSDNRDDLVHDGLRIILRAECLSTLLLTHQLDHPIDDSRSMTHQPVTRIMEGD